MFSTFQPPIDSAPPHLACAHLMGPPDVRYAGRSVAIARHKNRVVFYLLAARMDAVSRDTLYGLLWPDASEDQAHRALTQALSQLRTHLPDPAALGHTRESVWLEPDWVWSDVMKIDRLAACPPSECSTGDLETQVALYRGRFLDGVGCAHHLELEDWILAEADRLETQYLHALAELIRRYTDAGRIREATSGAERYLRINPYDERIHRRLLALYAAADDRNAAILHYRRCSDVLERELGVAPEPATCDTYRAVIDGRVAAYSEAF